MSNKLQTLVEMRGDMLARADHHAKNMSSTVTCLLDLLALLPVQVVGRKAHAQGVLWANQVRVTSTSGRTLVLSARRNGQHNYSLQVKDGKQTGPLLLDIPGEDTLRIVHELTGLLLAPAAH